MGNKFRKYGKRNQLLESIGYDTYAEYLASELWSTIRTRRLEQTPNCEVCGVDAQCVHHLRYTIDVMMGHNLKPLVPLCHNCHEEIEFDKDGEKDGWSAVTTKLLCMLTNRGQVLRAAELARFASRKYVKSWYTGSFQQCQAALILRGKEGKRKWKGRGKGKRR